MLRTTCQSPQGLLSTSLIKSFRYLSDMHMRADASRWIQRVKRAVSRSLAGQASPMWICQTVQRRVSLPIAIQRRSMTTSGSDRLNGDGATQLVMPRPFRWSPPLPALRPMRPVRPEEGGNAAYAVSCALGASLIAPAASADAIFVARFIEMMSRRLICLSLRRNPPPTV